MLTKVIVKFKDIDKIGREKAKERCKNLSSVTEAFQEVNQMFLRNCTEGPGDRNSCQRLCSDQRA